MARKRQIDVDAETNLLKEQHLQIVNRMLDHCRGTAQFLEKMERCGLDVSDETAINNGHTRFAEAVKREYFPNSP